MHALQRKKAAPGGGPPVPRGGNGQLGGDRTNLRLRARYFNRTWGAVVMARLPKPATGAPKDVDQFTKLRLETIEAVAMHPDATAFMVRVFTVMALRYVNREQFEASGDLLAWPSQKRLATETQSTDDGVRKALLKLKDMGVVDFKSAPGRGPNTRYTIYPMVPPPRVETQMAVGDEPRSQSAATQTEAGKKPLRKPTEDEPSDARVVRAPAATRAKTFRPKTFPDGQAIDRARVRLLAAKSSKDAVREAEHFGDWADACEAESYDWDHAWDRWITFAIDGRYDLKFPTGGAA